MDTTSLKSVGCIQLQISSNKSSKIVFTFKKVVCKDKKKGVSRHLGVRNDNICALDFKPNSRNTTIGDLIKGKNIFIVCVSNGMTSSTDVILQMTSK